MKQDLNQNYVFDELLKNIYQVKHISILFYKPIDFDNIIILFLKKIK